ncbi:hypothetical protein [Nocardia asiatica]
MATDGKRDSALQQLDAAVDDTYRIDEQLLDAMAYALECKVTRNEIARRVTVMSRPTVLSVLALIDRKDTVNRLLADGGVRVLTSDDTEEVWVLTRSKPRRGLTIEHEEDNLDAGGAPGTPERAAIAHRVAAAVVPILYDAGFELASGTTRLTRAAAVAAFSDPEARLWVEESSKP